MAHVYSTAVAMLYGVTVNYSGIIVKCKKPTISQIESTYHGAS